MFINVVSWNMQGWGSQYGDTEKIYSLFRAIQGFPPDSTVIMLQECGDPEETGLCPGTLWENPFTNENYKCYVNYSDSTADIKRCSTAILVSENLTVTSKGILTSYGVSRPTVYVEINNICFGTLHAIANEADSVPQVKDSLIELSRNYDDWLLMGDFNSVPSKYASGNEIYSEILNSITIGGTSSRPGFECNMIYSDTPTQGRNGTRKALLDFAFVCKDCNDENILFVDLDLQTKIINEKLFSSYNQYLSDHNMIGLQLTF